MLKDASMMPNLREMEAEKVWNTIKVDREKHADMLKCLTVNIIKNRKF